MQFVAPHKLTKDEAKGRITQMLDDAKTKPELEGKLTIEEERWEGDTFYFALTADGQHIHGHVEVKEKEYDITVTLPLMLRLFEGRIQQMINDQVKQSLG